MELKDKLLLGAAIVSMIVIFAVFAANKANSDPNQFVTGSYYTPKTTTKVGANEGNSWSNFAKGNKLECAGISNTVPIGTPISINGATKYKIIQYFPMTMEDLGINTNICTINTMQSTLKLVDEAGTMIGGCTELNLSPTLYDESADKSDRGDDGGRYEIIAPFAFTFDCSNIDEDRTTVSIISSNRQVKIVFEEVANWFCAGPVGTQSVYKSAGDDISCDWKDHGDHHASIIGHSKNAVKSGGSAGDLIAYGTSSTKMTLYVVENGQWITKSWYGILKKQ